MSTISRRSFLTASAALVAAPALGQVPASGTVEIVVIGAGAAGVAAARRLAAAKRRFAWIEASDAIGGRCRTDTTTFGVPYDRGAHWLYNPESNPLAKLASGFDIYPAPRGQAVRVGPRNARDNELETFLAALVRAHRAIAEADRNSATAAAALPRDLGDWQATIEFVLGPLACGKDLKSVAAADLARADDRSTAAFCRQGYGALLARLAADLPVRLSTPATRIASFRSGVDVETPQGTLSADAVILTASTNVLAADKIQFRPERPTRQIEAAVKLSLGSFDHVALEIPGNPFGLRTDDVVFEQASGPRTAALLANVSGSSLHVVEVAGSFGRELAAQGEAAMVAFAGDWLAKLFGASAKRAVKRSSATRWNDEPWVLGAMSAAAPGAADARKALAEPIGGRVFLAGEALHETAWGTVAGAWDSGTRAAEAALRRIGVLRGPEQNGEPPPPRQREPRHKSRRHKG